MIKNILFKIFPIILILFIFRGYFFSDAYLMGFAEWYSPYSIRHLYDIWQSYLYLYSDSNGGAPNFYPTVIVYWSIFAGLAQLLGLALGQKLLVFGMFYFIYLGVYRFSGLYVKNTLVQTLLAGVFVFNPYILNHFVYGHHVLLLSFSGVLFTGYFFGLYAREKGVINIILGLIVGSIFLGHPLYLPFYLIVILVVLLPYVSLLKIVKLLGLFISVFLFINAFWTLNLMIPGESLSQVRSFKGSDFNRLDDRSFSFSNSFILSSYYKKDKTFLNSNQTNQDLYDLSSFIIFLFIISFFLNYEFLKKNKLYFPLILASIIILMLLLSGTKNPFPFIFDFLYSIGLYSLYREPYHFVFPITLLTLYLLSNQLGFIKIQRVHLVLLVVIFSFRIISLQGYAQASISNKMNYITDSDIVENSKIYDEVCSVIESPNYTLFVPFHYTVFDLRYDNKDTEGGADMLLAKSCSPVMGNGGNTLVYEDLENIFEDYSRIYEILQSHGFRYVVYRDGFISSNENRFSSKEILKTIEGDSRFRNIANFGGYRVFQVIDYNEIINSSSEKLKYNKINNARYILNIGALTGTIDISLLHNFNSNFKFYLIQSQEGKGFYRSDEFSIIFKESLFHDTHKKVYDYANGWTISKDEIIEYIKKHYSNELSRAGYPRSLPDGRTDYKYYIENPDGSIDVELTLYFRPQLYFQIGLIISASTFAILIISLIVITLRERKGRGTPLSGGGVIEKSRRRSTRKSKTP